MEAEERTQFERQLNSHTTSFASTVGDCVAELPTLLVRHIDGDDYQSVAEGIGRLESDCDRKHREVTALVSSTDVEAFGIRLTNIYLNRGQLLELYDRLDDVANAAERFAADLIAIDPPVRASVADPLGEMAVYAEQAGQRLADAVEQFVKSLCRPECDMALDDAVETIRRLEGAADDCRNKAVAAAFGTEPDAVSLVYRDLATLLDCVLDAIEDVTDTMCQIVSSIEPTDSNTQSA